MEPTIAERIKAVWDRHDPKQVRKYTLAQLAAFFKNKREDYFGYVSYIFEDDSRVYVMKTGTSRKLRVVSPEDTQRYRKLNQKEN